MKSGIKQLNQIILAVIGLLILTYCSGVKKSNQDVPRKNGVLLFNSGFESGSRVVHGPDPFTCDDNIVGKDLSVAPPNDWVNNVNLGRWNFQYQQGDTTQRKLRIVPDPVNPENSVLSFWVRDQWVNSRGNSRKFHLSPFQLIQNTGDTAHRFFV